MSASDNALFIVGILETRRKASRVRKQQGHDARAAQVLARPRAGVQLPPLVPCQESASSTADVATMDIDIGALFVSMPAFPLTIIVSAREHNSPAA